MRLSKLIEGIECRVEYIDSDWEREIVALSTDSKKEQKGALFFCLSGGHVDAHAFAAEAARNGAVAVVATRKLFLPVPQIIVADTRAATAIFADKFYESPTKNLTVIGVTGTNGKTTTTYMLESIFCIAGRKTGVIGTLGVRYDGREFPSTLTTPDPIELQETLAKMRDVGVEYVFMEVSAHALYYKKTAGVRFRACIFSNLTQDHLDFFRDMQEYKQAKMQLFLPERCPLAVLNGDDEVGREIGEMRAKSGRKTVFYGLNTPADAFAVLTDEGLKASVGMLNINDKLCRLRLSLIGRHNVYNALAASTCAIELGVSPDCVARGLSRLKEVAGRLQRVESEGDWKVYIDFAHTPDGLAKSLDTLRAYCKGRLICLFGCGGNRDKSKRSIMGEVAAKRCDFAVLTSDNPRYEDPMDIITEVARGYRRFSTRYVIVPERESAIAYALTLMEKEDILLIAGKGGEEYQEIMGIKYPFNDQTAVIKYLQKKGENDE